MFTTNTLNSLKAYTTAILCGLLLLLVVTKAMAQPHTAIDHKGTIKTIYNGLQDWALADAYVEGQYVVYENQIYRANADVAANTAFVIGSTGATWTHIAASLNSTVHAAAGSSTSLQNIHNTRKVHIEPMGAVTIDANMLEDGFSTMLINHSGAKATIPFVGFTGVFDLNCSKENITTDNEFTMEYLVSVILTVTVAGANKYLNIHCMEPGFQKVTNELIFDGRDDPDPVNDDFYYLSMVINGNWRVTRLDRNDPNVNEIRDITTHPGQVTQPMTLAACKALYIP